MVNLLTKDFYNFIMQKYEVNEILESKYQEKEDEIPYFQLLNEHGYKILQLERVIGFKKINEDLEGNVHTMYKPETLEDRKKAVKKFNQLVNNIKRKINVPSIEI